jgi:putative ATP-dependent endonuclease of OLD family
VKICEVRWSNYRRLPDGHIGVREHLVLVGPNDTGKSSIVRALHLCLGMAHGQVSAAITERDFTDPSLPLLLTVTLGELQADDRAAFPDEITTGATEVLVVHLEATLDPTDHEQRTVRRYFPDSGHNRSPTRDQLKAIGFEFVPAIRSLLRELSGGSGGAVRSLLSMVDLTDDAAALQAAADGYRAALDGSEALKGFRGDLARALTNALPAPVDEADVRVVTQAEVLDDPLSGVTVTVRDGEHDVPLSEQSDGIRALSVLTLLAMSHKAARILAVDEPETHLHPSAQRAVAKSLRSRTGQSVLVTHSPSVVAGMNPMDIVTFRADRRARQLTPGAPIAEFESTVRHWSDRLIEPLTARRVVLVEGVSDRILVQRVAHLIGVDLDRIGVSLFELGGAKLFPIAYKLFRPAGFDVHLVGLLDEDASETFAGEIGVAKADLGTKGYVVCDPDLEGVYVDALGVPVVIEMLLASRSINERSLLDTCGVGATADIGRDALWTYCRSKKHKVAAALAVNTGLQAAQARQLVPLITLLGLVV